MTGQRPIGEKYRSYGISNSGPPLASRFDKTQVQGVVGLQHAIERNRADDDIPAEQRAGCKT